MSMDIGASANASVSADGSASAGASIGGGIGGALAGALGAGLSAGISVAGGLAISAAASFAANLNFSAGLSASFGASAVSPGMRPPDVYPAFKFRVQFRGIASPMRFQSVGQIHAMQNKPTPPAPARPPAQPATNSGPGHPAPHPAPAAPPTNVAQGGQGGAITRLPGMGWSWDELILKRGVAPDGIELLMWIKSWWTNPQLATRKDLMIFMLDFEGNPAMTWTFNQTFPTEWTLAEYKSDSYPGTLAFETLKLAWAGTPELIVS